MKKFLLLSLLILAVLMLNSVSAIPQKISFQGVLKDSAGNLVTASKDITFRIYDVASSGTSLWGETQTVSVESGLYTVQLGSVSPLLPSVFTSGDTRYLGIEVDGAELSPRTIILSVPYAYRANYADNIGTSGNVVLFSPVTAQTTSSANAIYIKSSAVGASVTSPAPVVSIEATGALAIAISANSTNTTAANYGGGFGSSGPGGFGVYGYATGSQGIGVSGTANNSTGIGVSGRCTPAGGGTGVYGKGTTAGGSFEANSSGGIAVYGKGNAKGGSFEATGGLGVGVSGKADAIGGYFEATTNSNGRAVSGYASSASGNSVGIYGATKSPDSYSAEFAGGKGIKLTNGSMEVQTGNLILAAPHKPASSTAPGDYGAVTWGEAADGTGKYYIYVFTGVWRRATLEAIP